TPEAGDYTFHMENGKTGGFGFYDGETKNLHGESGIFWWAKHYEGKEYLGRLLLVEHKKGNPWTGGLSRPRGMLWYDPKYWDVEFPDFDTSVFFEQIDVVTARDRWKNTQAFFAVKGAKATDTHGHMDATHFVFHSGGTSWEELPGTSNYNVDGWWGYAGVNGSRWQFYVARAEGHNTAFVDPIPEEAEFLPEARVRFDRYEAKPRGVIVSADTTDLHNGKVLSGRRGYFFTDNRRSLVVREEFNLSKAKDVYTVFHSAYKPEVNGNIVTLKNGPESLTIEFISNKPLEIFTSDHNSMFKDAGLIERAGTGYNIYAKVNGSGEVNITAKYTPNLVGNPTPITDYDMPISQWTIPDGELPDIPVLDSLSVGGKALDIETSSSFTVDVFDTNVPETVATSDKYIVEVIQSTDVREATGIKVTDPNDPTNYTLYSIGYRRVGAPVGFADVDEYELAGFEASAVPEAHNGPANLFDRNLDTRWSADKEQYMTVDLGEVKPVDTVMIAFYNGKSRSYNIWVEVSADGKNYTRVLDPVKSAGDTTDYERFSFPATNARYVRVYGNGSNVNEWNSWADMAVGISK
ncbi:MAG: discoidin domain-containing protein, partial [Clostridia bacterium]|nr:discoidin domain-containing protein [Clostridia bacterium]